MQSCGLCACFWRNKGSGANNFTKDKMSLNQEKPLGVTVVAITTALSHGDIGRPVLGCAKNHNSFIQVFLFNDSMCMY